MPRPCPACGRPNSEHARQCLYCVAPLPEGPAPETTHSVADPSSTQASSRYLIILAPQREMVESAAMQLSELTGKAIYDARLALQAKRHRLFQKVEGEAEAHRLSAGMTAAGIDHHVISEADIEALPIASVRNLDFHDHHMEVGIDHGPPWRLAYRDLLLVIRGEIVRERHQERHLSTVRGATRAMSPGLRVHLYPWEASLAAELDPDQFDWAVLGEERSTSTPINLKRLLELILSRAPGARYDRGFDWEPAVVSRTESSADVEALLSGDPTRQQSVVQDNVTQFRYYARWRYLVERAERRGRAGAG